MKKITLIIASLLIASSASAQAPTSSQVSLEEVVQKVSTENYTVYSNALRVYQARESVRVARANLLPKLNLWRIANVVIDWTSAVELIVKDIAPFLVPANWFRVQQEKLLYRADMEGYRALWANELMTAKALYVHLLLDRSLLTHVEENERDLQELLAIVGSRETFGGAPQGSTRDIEVRLLAIQEDKRALQSLVAEEATLLAFMMGKPGNTLLEPMPIQMPNFSELEPLNYEEFEFRALDTSPELRQFEHFIAAAKYVRRQIQYSFLGSASMSQGTAGGVFDNVPIQDGLGFGAPASMNIVRAQEELLRTQRKGLQETIRRQLKLLVTNYNLDLENYANLKRRVELTGQTNVQLRERLALGQEVDVLNLIEASRNHIQADTAFFAVQFRFLTNQDKLSRLIFNGDYSRKPVVIEELSARGAQ